MGWGVEGVRGVMKGEGVEGVRGVIRVGVEGVCGAKNL